MDTRTQLKITGETLNSLLLPGVTEARAQSLERLLREFISARELPLYRIMSYQMGWVDESGDPSTVPTRPRLFGQFAISLAEAVADAEQAEPVVRYSVALELLHNFTQIHEDVEDGNTEHDGRPSVWWTWGPAQAINAGDGMHAMARMALFSLTESGEPVDRVAAALKALDRATMLICEGEYIDITMQEQLSLSVQSYLQMVESRAGALFGASGQLAAHASGRPELADALYRFGSGVGVARQLARDYLLFWGGERTDPVQQGRLLTKKKNLPVAHAFESAGPGLKRKLGEFYARRVIEPSSVPEITSLLEEAGSRDFTAERVTKVVEEAVSGLDGVVDREVIARLAKTANAMAGLS